MVRHYMSVPPETPTLLACGLAWSLMADTSVCSEDHTFSRFFADVMVTQDPPIPLDEWLGWPAATFGHLVGSRDFEVIKVYADSEAFKWLFGFAPDVGPEMYVPLIAPKWAVRKGFQFSNPYRAGCFHHFKRMFLQQRVHALPAIRAIQLAAIATFLDRAYGRSGQ